MKYTTVFLVFFLMIQAHGAERCVDFLRESKNELIVAQDTSLSPLPKKKPKAPNFFWGQILNYFGVPLSKKRFDYDKAFVKQRLSVMKLNPDPEYVEKVVRPKLRKLSEGDLVDALNFDSDYEVVILESTHEPSFQIYAAIPIVDDWRVPELIYNNGETAKARQIYFYHPLSDEITPPKEAESDLIVRAGDYGSSYIQSQRALPYASIRFPTRTFRSEKADKYKDIEFRKFNRYLRGSSEGLVPFSIRQKEHLFWKEVMTFKVIPVVDSGLTHNTKLPLFYSFEIKQGEYLFWHREKTSDEVFFFLSTPSFDNIDDEEDATFFTQPTDTENIVEAVASRIQSFKEKVNYKDWLKKGRSQTSEMGELYQAFAEELKLSIAKINREDLTFDEARETVNQVRRLVSSASELIAKLELVATQKELKKFFTQIEQEPQLLQQNDVRELITDLIDFLDFKEHILHQMIAFLDYLKREMHEGTGVSAFRRKINSFRASQGEGLVDSLWSKFESSVVEFFNYEGILTSPFSVQREEMVRSVQHNQTLTSVNDKYNLGLRIYTDGDFPEELIAQISELLEKAF